MSITLQLTHLAPASLETPLLAVVLPAAPALNDALAAVDSALGGALARTLARRDFRGGRDETLLVVGGEGGVQRVLLVGRGAAPLTRTTARRAAAIAARQAAKLGTGTMHVYAPRCHRRGHRGAGDRRGGGSVGIRRPADAAAGSRPPRCRSTAVTDPRGRLRRGPRGLRGRRGVGRRTGHCQAARADAGQLLHARDLRRSGPRDRRASRHDDHVLGRAEMAREGMGSFLCVAQAHARGAAAGCARVSRRRPSTSGPSCSSARDSASIRAASRSSRRPTWSG